MPDYALTAPAIPSQAFPFEAVLAHGSEDMMARKQDIKPDDQLKTEDKRDRMPPEGPHARDELIDSEKTPGTGSLPDHSKGEADIGPD